MHDMSRYISTATKLYEWPGKVKYNNVQVYKHSQKAMNDKVR